MLRIDKKRVVFSLRWFSAGFSIAILLIFCSAAYGENIFEGPVGVYGTPGTPKDLEVGDFNNDGLSDILVLDNHYPIPGYQRTWYTVFLGNGDGTLSEVERYLIGQCLSSDLITGDFIEDGNQDLLIVKMDNDWLFSGNGDGTFSFFSEMPWVISFRRFCSGDFNEDNHEDIVGSCDYSYSAELFVGNGDGVFTSALIFNFPYIISSCLIEDVDMDGHEDIIVCCGYNLAICRGKGDGTFLDPEFYNNYPQYPDWADSGDFNGDGYPDIAVASTPPSMIYPSVFIYLNDCDGTFTIIPDTAYLYGWGFHSGIKAADFNLNGYLDLAVYGCYTIIMPGNGAGFFSDDPDDALFIDDYGSANLGITDLDCDNDLDLVTTRTGIYTFLNITIPQGFEEENYSSEDFTIFPTDNPFTGAVNFVVEGDFFPSQLVVYDITGRQIRKLTNSEDNIFHWNGTDASGNDVSSGTYLVQGSAEETVLSIRVMKL